MDIDWLDGTPLKMMSHDGMTHRFLIQEMKYEGQVIRNGQLWTLEDLARLSGMTVWIVIKREDRQIGWRDCAQPANLREIISEAEYRDRYRRWWNNDVTAKRVTPRLESMKRQLRLFRRWD